VFSDGRVAADCLIANPSGEWEIAGHMVTPVAHLTPVRQGATLAVEQTNFLNAGGSQVDAHGHSHALPHGRATAIWGWVSPKVVAVHIFTTSEEIDASVQDGVFAAWWPITGDRNPALTMKAYSADGRLLATIAQSAGPCQLVGCHH
jgi:hypothetical protein